MQIHVTGIHHSGTTAVQHLLGRQEGMHLDGKPKNGRYKESTPKKKSPGLVTKKPLDSRNLGLGKFLSENTDVKLVIVRRKLEDVTDSLRRAGSVGPVRREWRKKPALLHAAWGYKEYLLKNRPNTFIVDIEELSKSPREFLLELGFKRPRVDEGAAERKRRPKDRDHDELRQWQVRQPLDPKIIEHAEGGRRREARSDLALEDPDVDLDSWRDPPEADAQDTQETNTQETNTQETNICGDSCQELMLGAGRSCSCSSTAAIALGVVLGVLLLALGTSLPFVLKKCRRR